MVWVYLCNFVSFGGGVLQSPSDKGSSGALPLPTVITPPLPVYIPSSFLIKPGPWAYLRLGPGLGCFYYEEILFKGLYIVCIIIIIIIIII